MSTHAPDAPLNVRFSTTNVSSSAYRPVAVTARCSTASTASSPTSAPSGTTASTGWTGSDCRASTVALISRFSSRRRSCHSPRSTIVTTRSATATWRTIHFGRRANCQLTRPRVGVGLRESEAPVVLAVDDPASQLPQLDVVALGRPREQRERLVGRTALGDHQHALGLLDHRP